MLGSSDDLGLLVQLVHQLLHTAQDDTTLTLSRLLNLNTQRPGSRGRGAFNTVCLIPDQTRQIGVVTLYQGQH